MEKCELNTKRLYKLARAIVLIIIILALILAIYWGYLLKTDTLLHTWEHVCAEHLKTPDCMAIGVEAVNDLQRNFFKAVIVTVVLPTLFFGGVALLKYLFPIKDKAENA